MIVLELFAGTRSIGKAFEAAGHTVYSVDWDRKFPNMALYADIGTLTASDIIELCGGVPDVVWMSPDCTSYSIAAISHHRTKNPTTGELEPRSEYAAFCDKVNKHIINVVVNELKPRYFFIENPRAGMRKMSFVKDLPMYTVTYCQYGDTRQKPTDIWTNHPNPCFKAPCKRGAPCHEAAPRGSKTGTQGLKNKTIRAVIPEQLCKHIVSICEIEGEVNND